MKYTYLTDAERSEIEILRKRGYSMRSIAKVLGRSPNTVSYELKRCPTGYKAKLGKQYARTKLKNRRFQWRKLNHNKELREYVVLGLEKGWSPDAIAGRLRNESGANISHMSIYGWLYESRGEYYAKYLYKNRRKIRKSYKRGKKKDRIKHMVSIHDRPSVVSRRKQPGHWETDLVVSRRSGAGALSTHLERVSRYIVADYVPDTKSSSKQKTLKRLTNEFFVRSITFDRGHENSRHYELNMPTYFCDAYNSGQKGSNENGNKCIRKYFPKRTDFSKVSLQKIQEVIDRINHTPRKILGYMTPHEVAMKEGLLTGVS